MNRPSLNIWNNIEKTYGLEMNLVFENKSVVGIHPSLDDVIDDLDFIIKGLQRYRDNMADYYNVKPIKYKGLNYTRIYLIHDEYSNLWKIGRSIDPKKREKTLMGQSSNLRLKYTSQEVNKRIEKELHIKYKSVRVRGEWFALTDAMVEEIKEIINAT